MNNEQLNRSINSIGKGCFVKYFHEFSNELNSREDLIELLMNSEGYEESGCITRISQSRRIIKVGRSKDALSIIANSNRVPRPMRECATQLAHEL
jgi:hypothetical protein